MATPAGPLISPREGRPVPDPLNTPAPPDELHPAWLLTPADLDAIRADGTLRDRLARGERPGADDPGPAARLLAAWLHEVENGGAR